MATAILSAARNQPVRQDVRDDRRDHAERAGAAGRGIRERRSRARRFGIKTFVLPALNEPRTSMSCRGVRRDMTFVPAETLEQMSRSHSRAVSRRVGRQVAWRDIALVFTSPATASATPRASSKSSTRSSRGALKRASACRTSAPRWLFDLTVKGKITLQHARDRHRRRADRRPDARRGATPSAARRRSTATW